MLEGLKPDTSAVVTMLRSSEENWLMTVASVTRAGAGSWLGGSK